MTKDIPSIRSCLGDKRMNSGVGMLPAVVVSALAPSGDDSSPPEVAPLSSLFSLTVKVSSGTSVV